MVTAHTNSTACCFAAVLGAAALYALVPPESPFDLTAVPTDDPDESEVSASAKLSCSSHDTHVLRNITSVQTTGQRHVRLGLLAGVVYRAPVMSAHTTCTYHCSHRHAL